MFLCLDDIKSQGSNKADFMYLRNKNQDYVFFDRMSYFEKIYKIDPPTSPGQPIIWTQKNCKPENGIPKIPNIAFPAQKFQKFQK